MVVTGLIYKDILFPILIGVLIFPFPVSSKIYETKCASCLLHVHSDINAQMCRIIEQYNLSSLMLKQWDFDMNLQFEADGYFNAFFKTRIPEILIKYFF